MQIKFEYSETLARSHAHRLRCRSLPPMQAGEAARLVAEFLASRGSLPVPRVTRRRWSSSSSSQRDADTDDGCISHCHRHGTWSGSHVGGVSNFGGMTMDAHPNSDNWLITALRRMTVEQLLQLGTRQVVYLRAGMRDGKLAFVLYGADGLPLASVDPARTNPGRKRRSDMCGTFEASRPLTCPSAFASNPTTKASTGRAMFFSVSSPTGSKARSRRMHIVPNRPRDADAARGFAASSLAAMLTASPWRPVPSGIASPMSMPTRSEYDDQPADRHHISAPAAAP